MCVRHFARTDNDDDANGEFQMIILSNIYAKFGRDTYGGVVSEIMVSSIMYVYIVRRVYHT